MVNRLVSSRRIIAKVLSDLNISEDAVRISDMREWIGEAIERIGSVNQLVRKVTGEDESGPVKIINNQAKIPDDAVRINQVLYSYSNSGPWHPMRATTGNFNTFSSNPGIIRKNAIDSDLVKVAQILYAKYPNNQIYENICKMPYADALKIVNENRGVRDLLEYLIGRMSLSGSGFANIDEIMVYSMKPGFINTVHNTGYLKISYDAFPVDDRGYPLIPDTASYAEAIFFYVAMKLKYPDFLSGRMNANIYYDIKRSWNFYRKQAYAESMMPNADEMESIKNVWNRLIPSTSINELGGHDYGVGEYIYSNN